jgi:exopolysaccharide biosynthesis predicted pyruvyltransferase EpsI
MRLLPVEQFANVFTPLQGKRIGYVRPSGNVGDGLIEWATVQLFDVFSVDWRLVDPRADCDVDEIVFGGGGNMGTMYPENWRLRGACLQLGIPVTIFPQSYHSPEPRPFARVYARETASLRLEPRASLAPDLALGLDYTAQAGRKFACGVFLRRDRERALSRRWWTADPVKRCRSPRDYVELAARFEDLITDRLHFAICGLIAGCRTTLLPNSYHKNRSMHATWLGDLGCQFADNPDEALLLRRPRRRFWHFANLPQAAMAAGGGTRRAG